MMNHRFGVSRLSICMLLLCAFETTIFFSAMGVAAPATAADAELLRERMHTGLTDASELHDYNDQHNAPARTAAMDEKNQLAAASPPDDGATLGEPAVSKDVDASSAAPSSPPAAGADQDIDEMGRGDAGAKAGGAPFAVLDALERVLPPFNTSPFSYFLTALICTIMSASCLKGRFYGSAAAAVCVAFAASAIDRTVVFPDEPVMPITTPFRFARCVEAIAARAGRIELTTTMSSPSGGRPPRSRKPDSINADDAPAALAASR